MSGSAIFFDKLEYSSQTFTSNDTFNVPDGVHEVFIEMYGAGGGGGKIGSETAPGQAFGGEGGELILRRVDVTPSAGISVTIGTGGAGATSPNQVGGDGGETFFGSLKAAGGTGGGFQDITVGGSPINLRGFGIGKSGHRGNGGNANNAGYGGDGAHGNGGDGGSGGNFTVATDGGIAAGGGGQAGTGDAGDGGDGICIVYWKQP